VFLIGVYGSNNNTPTTKKTQAEHCSASKKNTWHGWCGAALRPCAVAAATQH
jgi:hypothetical protein